MAKKKKKKNIVATIGLDGKVTKHTDENNQGRTTGTGSNKKTVVATIGLDGTITKHNNDKKKTEPITNTKKRTYFNKGLFEDGYDFGDITKTLIGTATDVSEDLTKGVARIGEGLIDTGAYVAGSVAKKFGNEKFAESTDKFIARDLISENEKRLDKQLGFMGDIMPMGSSPSVGLLNTLLNKGKTEETSVLGDKSDSLVQSVGQLGGTAALQAVGVPWFVTTGVTGFGAGAQEALQNDATHGEAGAYGAISGASEIIFEKIGGIKFGGKTLLDSVGAKKFSDAISNKVVKNLTKFGLDAGAEGVEEVLTEVTQNIGQKLTYEDEKTWKELLTSEEAIDGYIEAAIGGMVIGGGFNVGKAVHSVKTGRDYDTGLTENEQNVVNREISQRTEEKQKEAAVNQRINAIIEEREKTFGTLDSSEKKNIRESVMKDLEDGKLDYSTAELSKKELQEIEKQVDEDLRSGNIGVDSIESVISAEKSSRINDLRQQLNETTNEAEKAKIEEELKLLEVARATELKGRIEKDSYLQESYRQEALKSKEFTREVTEKDSDITKELIESAKTVGMNDTKKMHDLFEYTNKIANDSKTKYAFVNNDQLKQLGHYEEGKTVNGLVRVDKDGSTKVLINVDSAKSLNTIIGHETTHLLEGSDDYKALQDIVKEYATTKGDYDLRYKQLSKLYQGTNANLENEITADLVGDYLFTDEQFINNLSTKNPNVFKRVYEYIKHVYKMATAGSAEARQLEQVKRKFDKAYKQISKTTTKEVKTNSLTEADSNSLEIDNSVPEEVATETVENEEVQEDILPVQEDVPDTNVGKTLTAEQEEYFKDSVVRDENGKLKVMYHGTSSGGHTVFDPLGVSKFGLFGAGSYFTDNKDVAESYTEKGRGNNKQIYETYLNITNPIDMDAPADREAWSYAFPDADFPSEGTNEQFFKAMEQVFHDEQYPRWEAMDTAMDVIESMGYDGITHIGGGRFNKQDETRHRVYIAFQPEQIKNIDNAKPTTDPDIRYSLSDSDGRELTKAQQEYFKDSKIRDDNGNLLVVYHGTPAGEFYTFDKAKGNVEGDFGSGFYFSNNESDMERNYEGGGADFESKVERRADLLEAMEDMDHEEAERIAREEMYVAPNRFEVYLNVTNPATVGETILLSPDDFDVGYDPDDFESEDEYYEQVNQIMEEAIDELVFNIERNVDIDLGGEEIPAVLYEAISEGGIGIEELKAKMDEIYLTDSEGDFVANEVVRQIIESLGYDGIIDPTVSRKWRKMGLTPDTKHFIVFKPEQIKYVDNENPTTDPDIRFSFSGESALNANNEYLVRAKDMAQEGVDSESIRRETGWFRGYDGKWRFEIDDSQMEVFTSGDAILRQTNQGYMRFWELYNKFSDGNITDTEWEELGKLTTIYQSEPSQRSKRVLEGKAKLKDVLKHDILFANYPQLKDVSFKVEDLGEYVHGVYRHSDNSIVIDKDVYQKSLYSKKRDDTLIHEIQHAIQAIEGFAYGSNPEYFKSERQSFLNNIALFENDAKRLKEKIGLDNFLRESITEVRDKKKDLDQHWEDLKVFKEQTAEGRELIKLEDTISTLYKDMNDYFNNMSSDELYWNTAGEIEARDAADRRQHSNAVRREVAPVSRLENVEKDNVIFAERYSLSGQGEDIAPTGNYNVYGSDVLMPYRETTAPVEESVEETAETTLPVRETIDMGMPLSEEDLQYVEQQRDDAFSNITDEYMPIEEDPVEPTYEEQVPVEVKSPFEDKDIKEVGKRDVKAYMYENPEVKPFFQNEAAIMLTDLNNSVRGKKYFNDQVYHITGGEEGFWGTTRQTTADIAELLDEHNYSYADIEKGLKAIIEDDGKENNAISKRIEFFLDERLREGYDSYDGLEIPPNEEYIELLRNKQIVEYDDLHYDEWLRSLAYTEPPLEELLPVESAVEAPVETTVEEETISEAETVATEEQQEEEPDNLVAKTRKELRRELLVDKTDFFQRTLDNAKNRAMALLNNTDTIRVQELVFGREAGKKINETIFQKAIDNESRSIYWQNKQRNELKALGIKPKSKMSAAVQKYAEKQYINEFGDIAPYGEAELKQEFPNPDDRAKVVKGARIIREKYDTYIDTANSVLTKLGFDPIPKREDYMRHFQELNDAFSRFGIPFNAQSMEEHVLPTDINGLTEFWSPQKSFFANTQPRKGLKTEYDAITGIDGYISGIANLIFHTEDIQRGRAFEEMIRNRFGQERAEEVLENTPEEERPALLEKIQNNHLSNYAAWVHEWTNNMAGKKNKVDRSIESMFGRRAFSFLDTTRKQVGANMIGLNLASSLTNLIAPVQAISKTDKRAVVKGTLDTFKNIVKKDGFTDQNAFLTARFGTDMLSKTPWQKMQDAAYIFMKGIDNFSSNLIVRSKYNELVSKGMSETEAHAEAGKFAARIMGDRTKGANAALYNSKLIGMVTQFQLEVNNQLYAMFYDTAHESKEKAQGNALKMAAGMTWTLGQLFAFTHVFGKVFEGVAGYNPTFDVVGIIQTLFGLGGDDEEEKPFSERAEAATLQLLKSLPYTSTFTGGRIPIGQAFPIKELVTGKDEYGNDKARPETLKETIPYYVLPAGYGQIKKTVQGLGMFDDELPVAGSYTDSGNLRFPVEETPLNMAQAAVFGQWANENAQDYIDNERAPLKEKQIQEYQELDIPIADYWDIREGLKEQKELDDKFDYIAGLDLPVAKKNIMINNIVDRDEAIDLSDYDDFGSYEEFDFATKYPEKYAMAQVVGGYKKYKKYSDTLWNIKANKDENGESIRGTRKTKVINYINGLEIPDVERYILFKSEYNSDDTHNQEIIDYLYNRSDISNEQREDILKQLGFTVSGDRIYW